MSWDPVGDGRTNIAAAYGLFFDSQFNGPISAASIANGDSLRVVAFQGAPAVQAWRSPGHRLPQTALASAPSLSLAVSPYFNAPYTHQYSVTLNRQLASDLSVSVSGIATKGNRYVSSIDYNPLVPSLGPGRRPADVKRHRGHFGIAYFSTRRGARAGIAACLCRRRSGCRGDRRRWCRTRCRRPKTASVISSAALRRIRDADATHNIPMGCRSDSIPHLERGPSLQDQRHRFAATALQELPFGLLGVGHLHGRVGPAVQHHRGARSERRRRCDCQPGPRSRENGAVRSVDEHRTKHGAPAARASARRARHETASRRARDRRQPHARRAERSSTRRTSSTSTACSAQARILRWRSAGLRPIHPGRSAAPDANRRAVFLLIRYDPLTHGRRPHDDTTTLLSDQPTVELIIRARARRLGGHRRDSAALPSVAEAMGAWAAAGGGTRPSRHGRSRAGRRDERHRAARHVRAAARRRDAGLSAAIGDQQDSRRDAALRPAPASRWSFPTIYASEAPSPEEQAIHEQTYARYRAAMNGLKPRERELVIARVEAQWTTPEIAEHFGFNTVDGARMAVNRAMQRLAAEMKAQTDQR